MNIEMKDNGFRAKWTQQEVDEGLPDRFESALTATGQKTGSTLTHLLHEWVEAAESNIAAQLLPLIIAQFFIFASLD
jgi:hypothetical protein